MESYTEETFTLIYVFEGKTEQWELPLKESLQPTDIIWLEGNRHKGIYKNNFPIILIIYELVYNRWCSGGGIDNRLYLGDYTSNKDSASKKVAETGEVSLSSNPCPLHHLL